MHVAAAGGGLGSRTGAVKADTKCHAFLERPSDPPFGWQDEGRLYPGAWHDESRTSDLPPTSAILAAPRLVLCLRDMTARTHELAPSQTTINRFEESGGETRGASEPRFSSSPTPPSITARLSPRAGTRARTAACRIFFGPHCSSQISPWLSNK